MLADRSLFNKGRHITWNVIIALHHHLMEELHRTNFGTEEDNFLNVQSLRGITRSVAFPDQLTQQNVSDAKKPFEEETISCQLQWMVNRLNCE